MEYWRTFRKFEICLVIQTLRQIEVKSRKSPEIFRKSPESWKVCWRILQFLRETGEPVDNFPEISGKSKVLLVIRTLHRNSFKSQWWSIDTQKTWLTSRVIYKRPLSKCLTSNVIRLLGFFWTWQWSYCTILFKNNIT